MPRAKGIKRKGNDKQSISQQTAVTVDAKDDREAVTNLKSLNERLLTTITNERREIDELKKNLEMRDDHEKLLRDKMTEDKQSWDSCKAKLDAQVLGLQNELDETRVFSRVREELFTKLIQQKTDLEDKLKGRFAEVEDEFIEARFFIEKHEELCTALMKEKDELENKVKEYNDETEELKAKMSEGERLWDSSKTELEVTVAGLQNELNETRMLSLKHEEACIQLRHEKIELEDQLKELNNKNEELHAKMTENGCFWDTKASLEDTIVKMQKKLNETKILAHNNQVLCREKTELENNLNHSINESKQLQEKMAEDAHLWDTCKGEFEGTVAKVQNELNEVRMLNQKHQDSWSQSRQEKNELEKRLIGLQNELDETKILSEKHQEVCNVLREENKGLANKLNQCNDRIGELNIKIEQDGHLWATNKADLESKIAGLEHEKSTLTQEYKLLCTHLTDEKNELEHKLRECNDKYEKLHAQMREDCSLWEACKAKFEDSVAGLENKLDLMCNEGRILRQEYVELCTECEFLKAQLGDYSDILSSVEDERLSLVSLSESNAKRVEALQTEVQLITDDRTHLSKKYREDCSLWEACKAKFEDSVTGLENKLDLMSNEGRILREEYVELCTECEFLKAQLGDYNDTLSSVEDERLSLVSLSGSNAKRVEALQTQVQLITDERTHLSKKYEELTTENEALKLKLENYKHRLDSVENERNSLRSTKASMEEAKGGSGRVSHRNQTAFIGNLTSCFLLDNKSTVSRCLSSGTQRIILPSDALLSGYPYGWFGGIV